LTGSTWNDLLMVDGVRQKSFPYINQVDADYFRMMGIPLVGGRLFSDRDVVGAPQVAVVDDLFGPAYMKTTQPIGRTFSFQVPPTRPRVDYQIVGVVHHVTYGALREKPIPEIYFAASQDANPGLEMDVLFRARPGAGSVNAGVIAAARDADPSTRIMFDS